jgi:hypothetical protein
MQLAKQDAFQARWSDDIHEEWIRSVLKDRSDLAAAQIARTRSLIDQHLFDARVTGYAELIPTLTLPDPDDRHVLAAAIVGGATIIVTFNLKDFPDHLTTPHDCKAMHPEEFLLNIDIGAPEQMIRAVRAILERLRNPPVTFDHYVDLLRRVRLPRIADVLASRKQDVTSHQLPD